MFKIRREQKLAFSEDAVSSFEGRMVTHLRLFFADRIEGLDQPVLRTRIRDGIRRAAVYDIVSERGVCTYIDAMLLHGDDFDKEPWPAAILQDPSTESPFERADRLLEAVLQTRGPIAPPSQIETLVHAAGAPPYAAPTTRGPCRAIVEIRFGPLAARKLVLDPGQVIRVGRSNVVDLSVPHDAQMSAEHLALAWDGERCLVRDLESANGTWLTGQRVREAEVASGAFLRAGNTILVVNVEAHTPPKAGAPAPIDEVLLALHALRRASGLHAIVDASRGVRPLQLLREAVDEHRSLYEGIKGEALAHCAPYLVAFRPDSGLLERLVREGWGAGWGIFFSCARPFKDVRRHFRRFLMVEDDETGERYYFRFYDPKALRVFLPTCTPRQRADFFGEISAFFAEGQDGEMCRFSATAEAHQAGARP